MTRLHVWGASGYAASEVIRYAREHPFVELGALESRSHAGMEIGDHFPLLRTIDRRFDAVGAVEARASDGDVIVTAGGHGDALSVVPQLLAKGARIIDLSADYRFDATAVYGLSEWNAHAIAGAALVANPGCYPTATSLALLPLSTIAAPLAIVVDAKSGISGAGRQPTVGALFAEVANDVRVYGLNGHRHQLEIERNLRSRGIDSPLTFTPHVVPMTRGMLVDAYALFDTHLDASRVGAAYDLAYHDSMFVRIVRGDGAPSVAAVIGTNDTEIRIDVDGPTVRIVCAMDNLGKGAAGQAVQNLNIMLGISEEAGLRARAIVA